MAPEMRRFMGSRLPVGAPTGPLAAGLMFLSVVLLMPGTAAAQSVLFRMNYAGSASPLAGWPYLADMDGNEGRIFTQRHVAGAGPGGRDVYRIAQIPNATSDPGFQFNMGWRGGVVGNPGYGSRRFYRFRIKFSSDTTFQGVGGGDHTNKLMFVGFGCEGGYCRSILNLVGRRETRKWGLYWSTDGGRDAGTATGEIYNIGQWYAVQTEIRASSSNGVGDGAHKVWVNNDAESSPTGQTVKEIRPTNHSAVWMGGFANQAAAGVTTWDIADFEIGTAFDSGWAAGVSTSIPSPAPPTNVRIVALAVPIPPAALALVAWLRRRRTVRN